MLDSVRRALEPTACQVFPINLLYLPLIYWSIVFAYFLLHDAHSKTLLDTMKTSTIQMFKNAFSMHPSAYLAGLALLIASALEYVCLFPLTGR
jgi:hypothetical protein